MQIDVRILPADQVPGETYARCYPSARRLDIADDAPRDLVPALICEAVAYLNALGGRVSTGPSAAADRWGPQRLRSI